MLYKHKKTGTRLKIHNAFDDGEYFMVEDQDGKVFTVYKTEISEDTEADKKLKTLQVKDKAQGEEARAFPPDTRLNINAATPQMIADHIKGVGMKTAKEIKDYQMSLTGERFKSLDQLKNIGRVDWEAVISANLIRV